MTWQPIETAPKDGTPVLLHYDNGEIVLEDDTLGAQWKPYSGPSGLRGCSIPTHWQPLPEPPTPPHPITAPVAG